MGGVFLVAVSRPGPSNASSFPLFVVVGGVVVVVVGGGVVVC